MIRIDGRSVGEERGCTLQIIARCVVAKATTDQFVGSAGHGGYRVGIQPQGLLVERQTFRMLTRTHRVQPDRSGAQDDVECVRVGWLLVLSAGTFDVPQGDAQRLAKAADNFFLAAAEILYRFVKAVGPELGTGIRGDKLYVHANIILQLAPAA